MQYCSGSKKAKIILKPVKGRRSVTGFYARHLLVNKRDSRLQRLALLRSGRRFLPSPDPPNESSCQKLQLGRMGGNAFGFGVS